jgi:hypothetical protein
VLLQLPDLCLQGTVDQGQADHGKDTDDRHPLERRGGWSPAQPDGDGHHHGGADHGSDQAASDLAAEHGVAGDGHGAEAGDDDPADGDRRARRE